MKTQQALHQNKNIHLCSDHHFYIFNIFTLFINPDDSYSFTYSCNQNASSSTEVIDQMNLVNSRVSHTGSFFFLSLVHSLSSFSFALSLHLSVCICLSLSGAPSLSFPLHFLYPSVEGLQTFNPFVFLRNTLSYLSSHI